MKNPYLLVCTHPGLSGCGWMIGPPNNINKMVPCGTALNPGTALCADCAKKAMLFLKKKNALAAEENEKLRALIAEREQEEEDQITQLADLAAEIMRITGKSLEDVLSNADHVDLVRAHLAKRSP